MQPVILRGLSALLATGLTLLSGAAMGQDMPDYGVIYPEYGIPAKQVRLEQTSLGGVVTDAQGQPIEGVKVRIGKHKTTTDARGLWTLEAVWEPGCEAVLKGKGLEKTRLPLLQVDGHVPRMQTVMDKR